MAVIRVLWSGMPEELRLHFASFLLQLLVACVAFLPEKLYLSAEPGFSCIVLSFACFNSEFT